MHEMVNNVLCLSAVHLLKEKIFLEMHLQWTFQTLHKFSVIVLTILDLPVNRHGPEQNYSRWQKEFK